MGNWDDAKAATTSKLASEVPKGPAVLMPEQAWQMAFEADEERPFSQRNAIEGGD